MATSELERPHVVRREAPPALRERYRFSPLEMVLSVLASLRLTVVLFSLAILLIFFGTLAQKDQDVWRVVNDTYFRVWFAQVDWLVFERLVQIFFKRAEWNLTGGFYFPGGKLIGLALLVNLAAAHSVRFTIAAAGRRLAIGAATIAAGLVITYFAIQSGMNQAVESELSPAFCDLLWQFFRGSLAILALAGAYVVLFMRDRMRRVEWTVLIVLVGLIAALAVWLLVNPSARLDNSGIRILWQLVKGTAAGVVLLTGCVLVFRKRAGIVLLHGGIALMMVSELMTGIQAEESRMQIAEGQTVDYSDDIRTTELAVIDRSPTEHDRVTVVPASQLVSNVGMNESIDDPDLPFKIVVHRWLQNSQLRDPRADDSNPATAGFGQRQIADELRPATGVGEGAQQVDSPSAYIELLSKKTGKSLGTFLTSFWLVDQPVEVDGRTYDLSLRFKRIYHPYSLTLKDFEVEYYTGTNTPKTYKSLVAFKDPRHSIDREVLIWMNNPLRYSGTTFYQADFDKITFRGTVLQVVKNPSWMTPYVACMLVATGMLAHFGSMLVRFLRRRVDEARLQAGRVGTTHHDASVNGRKRQNKPAGSAHATNWATFAKWFPAVVVIIFAGYIVGKARMPESKPSDMQIYEFGKLPLAYEGRVKPYDTLARNSLQILSTRQELGIIDDKGHIVRREPAIRWLLDTISGAPSAGDHRIFLVDSLDLLETLGLKRRPKFWRYSLNEIMSKQGELDRQIGLASAKPKEERSLFQNKVIQLAEKRQFYMVLVMSFRSPPISFSGDRAEMEKSLQETHQLIEGLKRAQAPHAVPPQDTSARWSMLVDAEFQALRDHISKQTVNPATIALSTMLSAYARGDVATFNKQLADYRGQLAEYERSLDENAKQLKSSGVAKAEVLSQPRIRFETFFNQFSPFYYAAVLYLAAFVLGALSWVGWTEPLRRSSIALLWFTFALHTFALWARMYISGRPPVTNLYSTAIFIGWGGVLMSLLFEAIYRLGLANIVAAVLGFLTLLVAYNLSLDGDTFIVLQAVLDTQFWLATHVVTINLGYATTYVAGLFGIVYLVAGHVFRLIDDEDRRVLTRIIYGTLCFAIFLSFIGTVLGGLWADDSWGRFWGWDPKENGALMIVLWNALVLHARWGGLVKSRGLATLAVAGNIVTTWSYFGVNELGVGLHAYGASESSTAMWLLTFAASQLALIVLGCMPQQWFDALRLREGQAG